MTVAELIELLIALPPEQKQLPVQVESTATLDMAESVQVCISQRKIKTILISALPF
jgi:hypothetical protein